MNTRVAGVRSTAARQKPATSNLQIIFVNHVGASQKDSVEIENAELGLNNNEMDAKELLEEGELPHKDSSTEAFSTTLYTKLLFGRLVGSYYLLESGVQSLLFCWVGGVGLDGALHLVAKEIWTIALVLMKILPINLADSIVLFLCYLCFGNTSKYGLQRPRKGPIYLKINSPTYPVVDAGTFSKIKSGQIEVFPEILMIEEKNVIFKNGKQRSFDAIILATGYRSAIKRWLKDGDYLIGDDGLAKQKFPKHWKGNNGLYCAGLVRRGLYGSAEDATCIANDISLFLNKEKIKIA
ncbi:putative indole-3-pyruvate monooxygenase YUCCA10 [Dendrobium catenatum]|uniref:indole-3-pyruvate monooxygenase n=1 Tax=Dendrobium catenatum TaxID=906689 RepID=A0A2I0X078_9ASPA|nr:putative indole-3-pyruvate monooxygenase YUCCA10 [Dendrobium catenatum]